MVDVVDEAVERVDALFEAALDIVPLGGGDDARDQVEGENALRALVVAVDVEGDAELEQEPFGGVFVPQQLAAVERVDGVQNEAGVRAHAAAGFEHLVEEAVGLVGGEEHVAPLTRLPVFHGGASERGSAKRKN